jgi:S-adenosylmethionine:tRNA ribosyltransferase-isomerase
VIRFEEDLTARVRAVDPEGGERTVFDRRSISRCSERIGRTPLPPYIRREAGAPDQPVDRAAYQTIFAREPLAVAAPTAGLHFTEEILEAIRARGVQIVDLTLAVGAGTFKPVTAEDTEGHAMSAEDVAIPAATLRAVAAALREGRRVVAVRTTVARSLRLRPGGPGDPRNADADLRLSTDLFITPGFGFRAVDAL